MWALILGVDPSNPWVVASTPVLAALFVASIRPLRKMVLWLVERNVMLPLAAKVDERNEVVTRRVIRQEINGSIVDVGNQVTDVAAQLERVAELQGVQHAANRERLDKIADWQVAHAADDDQRHLDMLNRIMEVHNYAHHEVHGIKNLMTPLTGQMQMMWHEFAVQHGLRE